VAETIPEVLSSASPAGCLEVMTRAVFQTGVSWKQIAVHWDAYGAAFSQFDPELVARYDALDVERALATPGVLGSPRKARATVANAKALSQALREHGSFAGYVRSFASYETLAKDFKKRFSFMGAMNVWYVLFRTGQPVPPFEEWIVTIPGDHPRMREMVDRARREGRSPELGRG